VLKLIDISVSALPSLSSFVLYFGFVLTLRIVKIFHPTQALLLPPNKPIRLYRKETALKVVDNEQLRRSAIFAPEGVVRKA